MKIKQEPFLLAAAVYAENFQFLDSLFFVPIAAYNTDAIHWFLKIYGVMRFGLKAGVPPGLNAAQQRAHLLGPLLNEIRAARAQPPSQMVVTVYDKTSPGINPLSPYNRSALSGISKLIWMLHPGQLPMNDRFARNGLRGLTGNTFRDNDYATFTTLWNTEFGRHAAEINQAYAWLQISSYASRLLHFAGPVPLVSGANITDIFRNRIFDLALHVVAGRWDKEIPSLCARHFMPSEMTTPGNLSSGNALI